MPLKTFFLNFSVKLTCIETKEFLWVNPLCLASVCPAFCELEVNDENAEYEILSEHDLKDLELIQNFCHHGSFPDLPYPSVFQDFGIDLVNLMQPVKDEPTDSKDEITKFLQNSTNLPFAQPVLPAKRKPGRPKKETPSKKQKIKKDFEAEEEVDWNDEVMNEFLENVGNSDYSSDGSVDEFFPSAVASKKSSKPKRKSSQKNKVIF